MDKYLYEYYAKTLKNKNGNLYRPNVPYVKHLQAFDSL